MLAFQLLFYTAQPDYSPVLLNSVSACLKISACLFWSPSASRLHPACSVSGSALEALVFFTLPYHRHATFQLVNHFHWSNSPKKHFIFLSSGHETRQQLSSCRRPWTTPDHICSRAVPRVSAPQCLPSLGYPGFPPFLFRLCICWFLPTSAAGGHSPHCLARVTILVYATSFFSASADFVLVYPQWYSQYPPALAEQGVSEVQCLFFLNIISKFFLLGMRKSGEHFCHKEAEKAQSV